MKRLLKRMGAILMAFCMSLSFAVAAYAEETVSGARISGATLQSDGTASWTIEGVPADREVEYYQLRFSRLSNGNWNDSYRTVNVYDETSYSMYFSSTGVYRFPAEAAARIAVETVRKWDGNFPEEVFFCCFRESDLNLYRKYLSGPDGGHNPDSPRA